MSSDFPSNSHSPKTPSAKTAPAPKKKVEKIVTSEVVQRKKSLGRRFKETFTGTDTKSVFEYVMFEVLIPAAKDTVADAVSQGVEQKLFGAPRSRSRRGGHTPNGLFGNASYNAYNRYSQNSPSSSLRPDPRQQAPERQRAGRIAQHGFGEFVVETRVEADAVIDNLFAILEQYEVVSVNDLYDLLGVSGDFTDEKWGWTDLRGAGVRRARDGYLLDLPRPEPIA